MSTSTLLEIVQDVHNDLDFDLVNSISDTTESVRVASIVRSTFYEFINRRDWPHLQKLGALESAVNVNQKTQLLFPTDLSKVMWINYNKKKDGDTRDKFEELHYQYPEEFIRNANSIDNSASNVVQCLTEEGGVYWVRNDRSPTHWTSFDDKTIVLDSFDSAVESSAQGINTQLKYYRNPLWEHTDTFVPDLPEKVFPGFKAEVVSVCAQKIKEVNDAKAEQQATRQQRRMSNQSWEAHGGIVKPNYGRPSGKAFSSVARATFRQDR